LSMIHYAATPAGWPQAASQQAAGSRRCERRPTRMPRRQQGGRATAWPSHPAPSPGQQLQAQGPRQHLVGAPGRRTASARAAPPPLGPAGGWTRRPGCAG
jgi:hypothetical protein